MKKYLTLLLWGFSYLYSQIVINEGSNKNYSTIADEDGEYKDWIELHNAGASPVDVYNYTLTDDPAVPDKWVLPHLVIAPGGFAVVFCSGKNRYASQPFTMVLNTGTFIPVAGWNNHPFTTPFNWDGVSNIVINVCSYSNTGYITNSIHRQTATAYNSTLYTFQDGSDASCYNTTGTTATQRPNLRLNGHTIGTGTITNSPYDYPAPYGNWYWGARHQMLIRASELTAAGVTPGPINSLSFDIQSTDAVTYTYVEYGMTSVSDNALTNEFYPLSGYKNHTNFKLSSGGETVYLYSPAGSLVSSLLVDCGPDYDVSVGSFPNASATLRHFMPPTPGASNNGSTPLTGVALPPFLSVNSGMFTTPFDVTIIDPNIPLAQIYYTTDGSEPTTSSNLYTGSPIPVYMNTTLRARAFYSGMMPSPVTAATYFFNINHVTPIISVMTDDNNLYGPTGMFDNYMEDWLRPAQITYFDSTPSHNMVFQQSVGIIMDGGYGGSRSHPQHSFRIELDNGVLGDGTVHYPVIPDRPGRTDYSNFYLRNGSNMWLDFPYKDATQVKMMADSTHNYYSAWRPVTVYINGQYFGLYELREKYDKEMFTTQEGANPDSIEILSLSAFYNYTLRALDGDVQHFEDDYDAFNALNPSDTAYWTQADQYFDMQYYNDYIIAEAWMGNTDWPGNNIKIYKSDVTGGRWRFCVIDLELAMEPNGWTDCTDEPITYLFDQSTDNPYINIWLQSIDNGRFKNYFINRFADVMNTAYLPARLQAIEQDFFNRVVAEMPNEYQRWGDPWNVPAQMSDFYDRHNLFQSELACRSGQVRDNIQAEFGLPQQVDLTLDVYPAGAGKIHISTVTPDVYPWNGIYFDGVPVKIEAIPNPGYVFLHWGDNGLIADTNNIVFLDTLTTPVTQFTAYFLSTLSVEEENKQDFYLYPNPATDMVYLVNDTYTTEQTVGFEVVDMNGKPVLSGMLGEGVKLTQLPITSLQAGIYFIRLKTPDGYGATLRFIKV